MISENRFTNRGSIYHGEARFCERKALTLEQRKIPENGPVTAGAFESLAHSRKRAFMKMFHIHFWIKVESSVAFRER